MLLPVNRLTLLPVDRLTPMNFKATTRTDELKKTWRFWDQGYSRNNYFLGEKEDLFGDVEQEFVDAIPLPATRVD